MDQPAFLITIDTEGDNLWSRPRNVTSHNAQSLPRFQRMCEAYGFKPTYLCNHEMAKDPFNREFGTDIVNREAGEIGMHLHAWDSPPLTPLTADDAIYQPYLIDYPVDVMRNKIDFMTKLLEDTFGNRPVSHRAGRWAFNERYAAILADLGYRVDCSVTPGVSWRNHSGDPAGQGGTDYASYRSQPYWLNLSDIHAEGDSWLLELPMTIIQSSLAARCPWVYRLPMVRRIVSKLMPQVQWLRPDGHNRRQMLDIVDYVRITGRPYLQFMLHSSEFMPGGSPTFPTMKSIDTLFADLNELFAAVSGHFLGATLATYWQQAREQRLLGVGA